MANQLNLYNLLLSRDLLLDWVHFGGNKIPKACAFLGSYFLGHRAEDLAESPVGWKTDS